MRIVTTVVGLVVLAATLTGCSGGSDSGPDGGPGGTYCTDIAAAKPVFDALASGDLTQLERGFTTFRQLAGEAPAGVRDEWKILDDAAAAVETALQDSGLKVADLAGIQSGTVPEGVDVTKLTTFAADLQKLNSAEFSTARAAITTHAKDSCNVELGAS